jgi:hypothetical protein
MDRQTLCLEFCKGLSDEALAIAVKADFTAALLWKQRDKAIRICAQNYLDPYGDVREG